MSGSSSSPQNTTSTSTQAQETNLAATNTQGVTLVGNKGTTSLTSNSATATNSGNTTISVDEGAVAQGTALGQAAIAANTGLSETVASDSFNFAGQTADTLSQSQIQSASLVSSVLTQGVNFIAQENQEVNQLQSLYAANLANSNTALANLAQLNSTSQATQSTEFATSALKIAAVVVLGVAVIYFASKQ